MRQRSRPLRKRVTAGGPGLRPLLASNMAERSQRSISEEREAPPGLESRLFSLGRAHGSDGQYSPCRQSENCFSEVTTSHCVPVCCVRCSRAS